MADRVHPMMLGTTVFERAELLGWSVPDLARRTGLSRETLYKLKSGERAPGPKTIEALLHAFPNLGYRDLFFPIERPHVQKPELEPTAA